MSTGPTTTKHPTSPDRAAFDKFIAGAVESAKESLRRDRRLLPRVMARGSDGREVTVIVDDVYCFSAAQPDAETSREVDLVNSQMYLAMVKTTANHDFAEYAIIVQAYHRNGLKCTLILPYNRLGTNAVFRDEMRNDLVLPPHLRAGIFADPYRRLQSRTISLSSRVRSLCTDISEEIRWWAIRLSLW